MFEPAQGCCWLGACCCFLLLWLASVLGSRVCQRMLAACCVHAAFACLCGLCRCSAPVCDSAWLLLAGCLQLLLACVACVDAGLLCEPAHGSCWLGACSCACLCGLRQCWAPSEPAWVSCLLCACSCCLPLWLASVLGSCVSQRMLIACSVLAVVARRCGLHRCWALVCVPAHVVLLCACSC